MAATLNRQASLPESEQFLADYYLKNFIPPEKKPFLTDLQLASGPYLGLESGELLMDAASQIASLGLGFNAGPLFGTAQYLESWTGQSETTTIRQVRKAYADLLRRKLGWQHVEAHFCNSGAEAIETALGGCFENRTNPHARRVLAFEGSFHGRMMVALASTWNRAKREPFAWPGYEASFAPYPEMDHDQLLTPEIPHQWQRFWSRAPRRDFTELQRPQLSASEPDDLWEKEWNSLLAVREQLLGSEIFAVILEPMQCEGGDRYSSARFHQALVNMARAFRVPLIYDEIQTGFGLGGEFFWHRLFQLTDPAGQHLEPDWVVCAKKAQTGVALSHTPVPFAETFSPASLVRGYIQGSVIDQFQQQIEKLETSVRQQLPNLVDKYAQWICRPRIKGISFAFDFKDDEILKRFIAHRFQQGLLYYPAGSHTARFRLNLAFREPELELLWQQLDAALGEATDSQPSNSTEIAIETKSAASSYEFHYQLLQGKIELLDHRSVGDVTTVIEYIERELKSMDLADEATQIVLLSPENYPQYRSQILQLQQQVYEPARQSPAEEFDEVFQSQNHLAILVQHDQQILAMAFGAPLQHFPLERGVKQDPSYSDPDTIYMLDLTIAPQLQGKLGRVLKQAMVMYAQRKGFQAIHGRNRDRLASRMWAINLSLGSFALDHLPDDYPDDQPHRDCIYYRCPVQWTRSPINLSDATQSPMTETDLTPEFVHENLPQLVNKVTLSNFVNRAFLEQFEDYLQWIPASLRHGYSASGLSECVDKIVKVLWLKRQPRTRLLTIAGSHFGTGSFLSRALSAVGRSYFDVEHLPNPLEHGEASFLESLKQALRQDNLLAMFVEPLMQQTMQLLPPDLLQQVGQLCRQHAVPVVYNDTAGLFYRYDHRAFTPSGVPGLEPDAAIAHLGGQMGVVCVHQQYFAESPLLLISTWDGDAYSLAAFHQAASHVQRDPAAYFETVRQYDQALQELLNQQSISKSNLIHGVGWFSGHLSAEVAELFQQDERGHFLSCPSYGQMTRFLEAFRQGTLA